jgi:diguanylate cyclase
MSPLYEIIAFSTAGLSGFAAGWWCRMLQRPLVTPAITDAGCLSESEASVERQAANQKAKNLLSQVHAITARVAAQVGEHHTKMQAINDELSNADGSDIDAIMSTVNRLVEANSQMQSQLVTAEKKMDDQARTIECYISEARTDALTGIFNRRAFDEELERCHEDHLSGQSACIMMIDVDYFKKFNDTHGHKAGDEVLKAVAKQLKETAGKDHVVCRYGGEEFAVLLRGDSIPGGVRAAERTRSSISALHIRFEGKVLRVTASAGLAEIIGHEPGERAVARADAALYCSKKAGRNQGHFHDGEAFKPFISEIPEALAKLLDDRLPFEEDELRERERQPRVDADELTGFVRGEEPTTAVAGGAWAPSEQAVVPLGDGGIWQTATSDSSIRTTEQEWGTAAAASTQSAERDPVTGLSTHTAFYSDLDRRLEEYKQGGAPVSIMMVQVDGWAKLVKKRGTEAGDFALKAVGRLLQATVRDMDHLARLDDDSFGIMFPTAGCEDGLAISRRLQQALSRCQLTHGGQPLTLTTSIGLATAQTDDTASRLLQRVTAAQNNAANRGGQMIFLHDGARLHMQDWQSVAI